MAKRELSTTLRNLKARRKFNPTSLSLSHPNLKKKSQGILFSCLQFMQRTAPREVPKPKDEEVELKPKPEDSFGASPAPSKRCMVIMEGNSHPGALRSRISFRSFNPSIDRLHEEASNVRQMKESNINNQNGSSDRGDGIYTISSDIQLALAIVLITKESSLRWTWKHHPPVN